VLVLAANLEEIEEVGCGSVNGDKIFVGLRRGCWEVDYFEFLRTLDILLDVKRHCRAEYTCLHIFFDLDSLHVDVLSRIANVKM
jgi:hypothetical protein